MSTQTLCDSCGDPVDYEKPPFVTQALHKWDDGPHEAILTLSADSFRFGKGRIKIDLCKKCMRKIAIAALHISEHELCEEEA